MNLIQINLNIHEYISNLDTNFLVLLDFLQSSKPNTPSPNAYDYIIFIGMAIKTEITNKITTKKQVKAIFQQ